MGLWRGWSWICLSEIWDGLQGRGWICGGAVAGFVCLSFGMGCKEERMFNVEGLLLDLFV